MQTVRHDEFDHRNNYLNEVGGDPITAMYAFRPLIENNVAVKGAREIIGTYHNDPDRTKEGGNSGTVAAGIWPWKCKTAIFQYNECYDLTSPAQGNGDGQAWDADSGDSTVYQYNYSSGNPGGAIMYCWPDAYNSIFRYNISYRDGVGSGVLNTCNGTKGGYYNNTFIIDENAKVIRENMAGGDPRIENNIFYQLGARRSGNWERTPSAVYSHNLYYNFSNKPNSDRNAVVVNAGERIFETGNFAQAPTAPTAGGIIHNWDSDFNMFRLAEGSPALDKGKQINLSEYLGAGGYVPEAPTDFYQNELSGTPEIGAHDTAEPVAGLTSDRLSVSEEKVIFVPIAAKLTVAEMKTLLHPNRKSTLEVYSGNAPADADVPVTEDMIVRTALRADPQTMTDYTVQNKSQYHHFNEFQRMAQGPVWYYERYSVSRQEYQEFTQWKDDANKIGWWGGEKNDYTSAERAGACGDIQETKEYRSSSIGWKAPVNGKIRISFDQAPRFRESEDNRQSQLVITKDGVALEKGTYPISSDRTPANTEILEETVTAGQMIRFEVEHLTRFSKGGVDFKPVITYVDRYDVPELPQQEDTPPQWFRWTGAENEAAFHLEEATPKDKIYVLAIYRKSDNTLINCRVWQTCPKIGVQHSMETGFGDDVRCVMFLLEPHEYAPAYIIPK